MTTIKVLGKYLWLWLWPAGLSCDYSFNRIPLATAGDWQALLGLAAVAGLCVAAVVAYRRNRAVFFFIAASALTICITSCRAWAIIMRSKGSLWIAGRLSIATT